MLEMGLDAQSTSVVVEMLDTHNNLLREYLVEEILETTYNEQGYFPEPHWKIFAQGFEAGIAKAVEVVKGE